MNARVRTPSPHDDALLWLCVKHPPMTLTNAARILGKKPGTLSQNMQKLKAHGFIDRGHGSCVPYPKAIERVRFLEAHGYKLDLAECRAGEVPVMRIAMEPRGSIARPEEPPLTALIDALASFQDPLLAQANAQLRLRVTELEAENARLRSQVAKTLQRLGFAADALTG